MVEGEDGPLAITGENNNNNNTSDEDVNACVADENNKNGGLISNADLGLDEESGDSQSASDDEEILKAEAKLEQAKKGRKRLLRKEKLERITQETNEVERSLSSLRVRRR